MVADEEFTIESYKYFKTDMSYFNTSDLNGSLEFINEKISTRTNGQIQKAVKSLDNSDMIIINSLVLDLPWFSPFKRTERNQPFTKADGSVIEVPMMTVSTTNIKMSKFKVGRTKQTEMRVIRVPYGTERGGESSLEMRIYLGPRKLRQSGVEILLDSNQNLDNIFLVEEATEEIDGEINLILPVFTSRSESDLATFMKQRGINRIFSPEAELTEMTKNGRKFSVSNINQEVVVNVTEYGTRAAAVTTVELALLSADQAKVVNVNVPFIFSIWDTTSDIPLIAGIINDPTDSA